jgi:hypothetical protein
MPQPCVRTGGNQAQTGRTEFSAGPLVDTFGRESMTSGPRVPVTKHHLRVFLTGRQG